ncbi:hypothetical protein [Orrella dioscoreae]|uniref:Uncharacterized protein n=1 Tax=Orrella dioscoreae TaxID=1851544 RepID=A0A1C3K8B9_9BURK|nr:hypothetical protein [Orrella dioscoreae]SBT27704.1 hypothetical protein ODI_00694 [Orrella dioscoreae]SOE48520.1 hypothetical protein ODI_R1486 [Orrella dioscoreae]
MKKTSQADPRSSPSPLPPEDAPRTPVGILDRLRNTPLGAADNRLRLGLAVLAYAEGVLVVETEGFTHVTGRFTPEAVQVRLADGSLLIDLWHDSGNSLRFAVDEDELEEAGAYFSGYGFAVTDLRMLRQS